MATIPFTWEEKFGVGTYVDRIRWTGLQGATSDVGDPLIVAGTLTDKCVQLIGVTGPTVVLEGTNADPVDNVWETLTNPAEVLINDAITPKLQQILQNPYAIRPRVAGAAANISVVLIMRRPRIAH